MISAGAGALTRFDRAHLRVAAWMATTLLLTFTLYSHQTSVLMSGLNGLVTSTLGTVFPAYPFLALLVMLTALRWRDFHRVLLTDRGLTSKPIVRIAGVVLVFLPATLWTLSYGSEGPSSYLAMELSASSLVLMAYGSLLALNPALWRTMLPYASLYAVGLVSPLFMLDVFGVPLAALSSYLAAGFTNLIGVKVAWQGMSFVFVSASGDPINAIVTPACSAAYSISIYLALLGLMYLDMGGSLGTTSKFAIAGVVIIPILNSGRIALTIWSGYVAGPAAFWGIHDWLGYGIFIAFYLGVLVAYSRASKMGRGFGSISHAVALGKTST